MFRIPFSAHQQIQRHQRRPNLQYLMDVTHQGIVEFGIYGIKTLVNILQHSHGLETFLIQIYVRQSNIRGSLEQNSKHFLRRQSPNKR